MNIFWDLDGTILDHSRRLFYLFSALTETNALSYDEYWELKSAGNNQRKMLDLIQYDIQKRDSFSKRWLDMIEQKEWLSYDCLQPHIKEVLASFRRSGYEQYIVTNRRNVDLMEVEVTQLGIFDFFTGCFSTYQKMEKNKLIEMKGIVITENDYFIGDSPEDIRAGKALGIHTIAVDSIPARGLNVLSTEPEYYISDRRDLERIIYDAVGKERFDF